MPGLQPGQMTAFDKQDACRPRQTGRPSSLKWRANLPLASRSRYRCVLNVLANWGGYAVDAIAEFFG